MKMNEKTAIELLRKHSSSEKDFRAVLAHSQRVKEIALDMARGVRGANIAFIRSAALIHDIGRFRCPPWKDSVRHGIEGGKLLRSHRLGKYALVAERHLGAGITKEDITEQRLPLPHRDFVPRSIEEKIVTLADKLTDGDRRIGLRTVVERFKKEISPKAAERIVALYREVEGLKSGRTEHRKTEGRTAEAGKKGNHQG
jgi:uncharacterized protein (TIGR00295 family)